MSRQIGDCTSYFGNSFYWYTISSTEMKFVDIALGQATFMQAIGYYYSYDEFLQVSSEGVWHPLEILPRNKLLAGLISQHYIKTGELFLINNNLRIFSCCHNSVSVIETSVNSENELTRFIQSVTT
jgi:hypothetical protein